MSAWDASLYLQFGNERTQPAIDLVSRINVTKPARIIDLGCGPGNSTEILRKRWPRAIVAGLDNSPEMIAAARNTHPHDEWILADAATWQAASPVDIVFSNAALQWIPDHGRLVPRLLDQVAHGGALAFQMPSRRYSLAHEFIVEIANDGEWAHLTHTARDLFTLEAPGFYYDALSGSATRVDMWETEYYHRMDSHQDIITWLAGAAVRPFLDALQADAQRKRFMQLLTERIVDAYHPQRDGKVLFPFRRLFVVAYR